MKESCVTDENSNENTQHQLSSGLLRAKVSLGATKVEELNLIEDKNKKNHMTEQEKSFLEEVSRIVLGTSKHPED